MNKNASKNNYGFGSDLFSMCCYDSAAGNRKVNKVDRCHKSGAYFWAFFIKSTEMAQKKNGNDGISVILVYAPTVAQLCVDPQNGHDHLQKYIRLGVLCASSR